MTQSAIVHFRWRFKALPYLNMIFPNMSNALVEERIYLVDAILLQKDNLKPIVTNQIQFISAKKYDFLVFIA